MNEGKEIGEEDNQTMSKWKNGRREPEVFQDDREKRKPS